jgi:hypothetical protein
MQIKTIKKVISKKLEDWLVTIEDMKLRDEVRKNYVVSGGSITSLLLGIPVNDYDIYIQDIDILIKLARYYCPGIVLDGRQRDEYIKHRFPKYDSENPNWMDSDEKYAPEHLVRLLTLKQDQVKLDIVSQGIKKESVEICGQETKKYQIAFLSQNAISLTDDIQIVLRFSGSVELIHKTFDFIHATNYFTFKEGLVTNVQALESIITKTLKYQGSVYPLTSIIRMKKFINRGWHIGAGEMLKVMFQISELDLHDLNTLEEQLIGVDVAYFSTLIEILRGVDPEKINASYLASLIDKVFNDHEEPETKEDVSN